MIIFGKRSTLICIAMFSVFVAGQAYVSNILPVQKETKKMDKETLAKKVETINPEVAEKIRSEKSTIEQIETPFFRNGSIYRIIYLAPYRPITFVYGIAGEDFVVSLPNNQKNFIDLAQKADLKIDSDALRLNYVEVFLESTRDFQSRFQIIRQFDDIELINEPTEKEKENYDSLKTTYKAKIKPPEISGQSPSLIKLFVLKKQDLLHLNVKLSSEGHVDVEEEILETNLPIAYVK